MNPIFLIVIVATIFRLPLIHTPFWRTPDAVEYISVARNINAGLGLTSTVKANFIDHRAVITSALNGRPVGMALILAAILRLTGDFYSPQIFSLTIGVVNAVLVYLVIRKSVSTGIALLGGLLAAMTPNIIINNRLVISEPVFATFLLMSLLFFRNKFLVGFFLGIAYLIRLEGLLMFIATLVFLLKDRRAVILTTGGFLLFALPYWLANYQINGSPFYTYNTVHFQMRSFLDWIDNGFEKSLPPASVFLKENFWWIIPKVLENFVGHLRSLGEVGYFGPLAILLILGLRKYWKKYRLIIVFSGLTLLLYALMWSAIFERARHFIPIYLLLLFPTLHFINDYRRSILVWSLVVMTFVGYFAYDLHRVSWARGTDPKVDAWSQSDRQPVYDWIKANVSDRQIIAGSQSLYLNLWTSRPAINYPDELNVANYDRFVKQYRVDYFLNEVPRRDALLSQEADFITEISGMKIYRVRTEK